MKKNTNNFDPNNPWKGFGDFLKYDPRKEKRPIKKKKKDGQK